MELVRDWPRLVVRLPDTVRQCGSFWRARPGCWMYAPGATPAGEQIPLDLDAEEPRRSAVDAVAALEESVRKLPHWVVLRYGMFYGPDTWYAPAGLYAERARAGALVADADVTSFVHVDDAATAALAALDWPSGAVNVCDDDPAAGVDWVPAFCRAVGAPPPPVVTGDRTPTARGADNTYSGVLGWAPHYRSWRDGFRPLRSVTMAE
jgi:nucleoside-diphosphate-sugar epimerase